MPVAPATAGDDTRVLNIVEKLDSALYYLQNIMWSQMVKPFFPQTLSAMDRVSLTLQTLKGNLMGQRQEAWQMKVRKGAHRNVWTWEKVSCFCWTRGSEVCGGWTDIETRLINVLFLCQKRQMRSWPLDTKIISLAAQWHLTSSGGTGSVPTLYQQE